MPSLRALGTIVVAVLTICSATVSLPATQLPNVTVADADPICLNTTQVRMESIRTKTTVDAIESVIDARETCNPGSTRHGRECVRSIVSEVRCEDGYEWLNGRCERVEDSVCPAGYHKSDDGECVLRVEVPVQCPPGHDWDGENCVHRMPSCQPGYRLVNGGCVKLVAGECPVGTVREDDICVRTQTAIVECNDGFELVGDECRQPGQTICDDDFELIDGQCVLEQTIGPVYECPDDMRLLGTKCVSLQQRCPAGFTLKDGRCVNETISCPGDAKLDSNGQCVRNVCAPVVPVCEEGMRLENGICYQVITPTPVKCNVSTEVLVNRTCVPKCAVLEPLCPPGSLLQGDFCLRADDRRRPTCPDGFELSANWCVRVHPSCIVQLPECEPGYQLRDSQCVRVLVLACPEGFVLRGGQCEVLPYECLAGYVLVEGKCLLIEQPVCPTGRRLVNGVCELIGIPPIVKCPPGHHLNGTVCVLDNLPPMCPADHELVGGWCVPRQNPVVPSACPDGQQLRDGKCYQQGVPPTCPPGYTLWNKMCYCRDNPPPIIDCPAGHELSIVDGKCHQRLCAVDEQRLADGTCQKLPPQPPVELTTTAAPPTASPPTQPPTQPPTLPPTRPPTQPPSTHPTHPTPQPRPPGCPKGYAPNADGDCVLIVWPIVCPRGYYYTHGACYPKAPPIVDTTTAVPPTQPSLPCVSPCSENVVHTVTLVDRPVHVVTNNENNVNVHIYENGRLVRIQRNNETEIVTGGGGSNNNQLDIAIAGPPDFAGPRDEADGEDTAAEDDDAADDEVAADDDEQKCCTVVSPRKCVRGDNQQWECHSKETQRCGKFCTSPKIYLIPRRNECKDGEVVMRPPPIGWMANPWLSYGGGYSSDCSGCQSGGYSCSQYCYHYETCSYENNCQRIDQQSYCQTNGGSVECDDNSE